jgi:hypothetical protein
MSRNEQEIAALWIVSRLPCSPVNQVFLQPNANFRQQNSEHCTTARISKIQLKSITALATGNRRY